MKRKRLVVFAIVLAVAVFLAAVYLGGDADDRRDERIARQCAWEYWWEHGHGWAFDHVDHISTARDGRKVYIEGMLRRDDDASGFYLNVELQDDPQDPSGCICKVIYAEISKDQSLPLARPSLTLKPE